MNRRIKRFSSLLVSATVIMSAQAFCIAAEAEDSMRILEPVAKASIGSWANSSNPDRDKDLTDGNATHPFACGATSNIDPIDLYMTDRTGTTSNNDIKANIVRFDLGDEVADNATYTIKVTGGNGGFSAATDRFNDIKWYVAVSSTAVNEWTTYTWNTRPAIDLTNTENGYSGYLDLGTTTYDANTESYSDLTGDITSLLKDKSGQVTLVLLNGMGSNGKSQVRYSSITLECSAKSEELPALTDGMKITAGDIIERGGAHHGSAGDTNFKTFGKFKNINDELKYFYPNATTETELGNIQRISCLDNGTSAGDSKWNGYIELDVSVGDAGDYDIYILCNTGNQRRYEVTNSTCEDSVLSTYASGDNGVAEGKNGENDLEIVKAEDLKFNPGVNTIKVQAAAGESAPNFYAMYIKKAEKESQTSVQANIEPVAWSLRDETAGITADGNKLTQGDESVYGYKAVLDFSNSITYNKITLNATAEDKTTDTVEKNITSISGGNVVFYIISNKAIESGVVTASYEDIE